MNNRQMRRSGISITFIMDMIGWKPDVIYQVGIGQFHKEVDVMKEVWSESVLIGCEPNPDIVSLIEDEYPGEIYECAIGSKSGKSTLFAKERHKDGSSLYPHISQKELEYYSEITVLISTLDTLFPEPKKYGEHILLWVDCEGGELEVLIGGRDFLKNVEVVNVEVTSNPPGDGWCTPEQIHLFLMEAGFYRLWIHTQRIASMQCDAVYVRPELFQAKACCCPDEVIRYRKERSESSSV